MLKALIIDDESKAINLLKITVEQSFPGEFLVESAQGSADGLDKINQFKPDLLFLDIEMPMMNGFDLLTIAPEKNFRVIFTTAYNEYAIRAIRYNALDYLLKPIDPQELSGAIQRFQNQRHTESKSYEQRLESLVSNREKHLAITTYEGVELLGIDTIIRCEADMNYTRFHLKDNKSFLSSKTLKEYEELLEVHSNFIRVHRSHLVNIDFVLKFRSEGALVLKDHSEVPVSRRKKEFVLRKLK